MRSRSKRKSSFFLFLLFIVCFAGFGFSTHVRADSLHEGWLWPTTASYRHLSRGYHSSHSGIDITVSSGSPVYASKDGTVLAVYTGCKNVSKKKSCSSICSPNCGIYSKNGLCNWGYGNGVIIKHADGSISMYAHMSSVSVSKNQSVSQGNLIGYSGSTGNSTGPHLHFELASSYTKSGTYYKPASYNNNPKSPDYHITSSNKTNLSTSNGYQYNSSGVEYIFTPSNSGGGGSSPQITSTRTVADGEYHIVTKLNPAYGLNVSYNGTESGRNIQINNHMEETDTYSLVQVTWMSDGYYKLTMKNSGKVLDVQGAGMTSGTNVQQYNDTGHNAQRWIIQESGDGWFYIISKLNGLYLDVYDSVAENYKNVWMYKEVKNDAQKWRFVASGLSTGQTVENGEYHVLTALNTDYAADISASSQDNQANLLLWGRREADRQIFTFKYLGNGYYSITAKHSGKVLEASNGGTYNKTNVVQQTWNGSDAQKWIVKKNSDGMYFCINKASGLYLDLYGAKVEDLNNIWLYLNNGNTAQKWKLVKHDPCTCSGHAWNTTYTVDKAATCAAEGSKSIHCSRCGAKKDVQSVPKLAHKWNAGAVTKTATCAAAGVKTYTCTVCKATKTEAIAPLSHTAGTAAKENVRAATCTAAGSYDLVTRCKNCNTVLGRNTVALPLLGHAWNTGVITTAATTSAEGIKTYTCTRCGATRTEAVPKLSENTPVPVEQAPAAAVEEGNILRMSGDEAPSTAKFNLLQLRTSKITKTSITLKWKKVAGASGYIIYGNRCGSKYTKIKTINSGNTTSWTKQGLKKGKYYKFFIVATAMDGATEKVIASSMTIHVATSGGKVGNDKAVKLTNIKNGKKTLKAGKSFTIKAKPVPSSSSLTVKRHRKLRFESTDSAIASVGKANGKITAKKAGTCTIYVYAQSGAFKAIKITVK